MFAKFLNTNFVQIILIILGLSLVIGYASYRIFAFVPVLLSIILLLTWKIWRPNIDLKWHKTSIYIFVGVLSLGFLSLIWAEFFDLSYSRVLKILPLLLGGALCLSYFSSQKIEEFELIKLKRCFFVLWAMMSALYIFDMWTGGSFFKLFRPSEEYVLPLLNRYAIVIFIGYIFTVLLSPLRFKIISSVLFIAFFIITESQSVQLSFIAFAGCLVVWKLLKTYAVYIIATAISVMTIAFPWFSMWMFQNRPETLGDIGVRAAAFNRLEIWDAISKKIMLSPWVGYGLENIRETKLDMAHMYWKPETVLHPHNYALQLWVELGLVGIVSFLAGFWLVIWRIKSMSQKDQLLALSLLVSIIAINLTAYGLWQGWWIGFMLMSVMGFYIFRPSEIQLKSK